MLEWKPKRLLGVVLISAAAAMVLLMAVALILYLRRLPLSFPSFLSGLFLFLSLFPLLFLGYRLYQLLTLKYLMGRDSVIIACGSTRHVVPLDRIESIMKGEPPTFGFPWPGFFLGKWRGRERPLFFYATLSPQERLCLVTPRATYVLSPANGTGFLAALEARRQMGPSRALGEETTSGAFLSLPFLRDRLAQALLLLGALANASLFAYVTARYPSLPGLLPFHFDIIGMVDRIAPKGQILRLPAIGLAVFLANSLLGLLIHPRERMATYLLAGASLLAQILLAVAILHIIY